MTFMSVRRHREWALLGLGLVLVLATRLPFLPPALEDLDSVNFDLGVHDFDPYEYRPHPPGYAVFIGLAKVAHPLFASHATGLALLSAVMSALALVPLYLLARRLIGPPAGALAALFVVFNPVFWMNGVRPMSDLTGFAAIVTAQWLLVAAVLAAPEAGPKRRQALWYAGVAMAALSIGVRLQAIVLVGPMLAIGWVAIRGIRIGTPFAFAAALAVWLIPTLSESGGPSRFWAKQMQVIAEAWPSEPLVAAFSEARAWRSVTDTFLLPWGHPILGAVLVACAGAGLLLLWFRNPRHAAIVCALFAPYALYHTLLQETGMVRYAIPLLPFTAIPAAVLLERLTRTRHAHRYAAAALFVVASVVLTAPSLRAYAQAPSPPALALDHIRHVADTGAPTVVAGNHVFARYVQDLPASVQVLPLPSWLEWRELNRYWMAGGANPVWFLRDPVRTSLDVIDPAARTTVARWEWPARLRQLLSGSRPTRVELVRVDRPRWFVDTGYLASGEAGPFAQVEHEPHVIFVRGDLDALMVITVRSRGEGPVAVTVGDHPRADAGADEPWRRRWDISGTFTLPLRVAPGGDASAYVPVRLEADHGLELIRVSLPPAGENVLAPLRGLFDFEPDEFGETHRWMGQDAALLLVRGGGPARLHLRGRIPVQYYDTPPGELRVTIDDGEPDTRALDTDEANRFTLEFDLPDAARGTTTRIDIQVSHGFTPHEHLGNGDTRRLSLMMYEVSAR